MIGHHSDIVRQKVLKHALRTLENALYRRAAAVLPTSESYVEESNLLKRFPEKITPLALGTDLTPFRDPSLAALEFAAKLRATWGSPLRLSVGRLIYYRGLEIALEALKNVPGTLVVIGSGPLESELKKKAESLGVANRVCWFGHATADELNGAYHAATALWFPSIARSEGFGLVQVEAMPQRVPRHKPFDQGQRSGLWLASRARKADCPGGRLGRVRGGSEHVRR